MYKNISYFKLLPIYLLLSIITVFNLEIQIDKYIVNTNKEEKILNSDILTKDVLEETDDFSYQVLSQEIINLSHYGHDCYGCESGYTASGYYIGDGRIHYEDSTYGTIRVVAADKKYPLGTIVRINYHDSIITAIVLDRGGAISDQKKFQIDLLTTSTDEAYKLGIIENTNLEVLRLGY